MATMTFRFTTECELTLTGVSYEDIYLRLKAPGAALHEPVTAGQAVYPGLLLVAARGSAGRRTHRRSAGAQAQDRSVGCVGRATATKRRAAQPGRSFLLCDSFRNRFQ